MSNETRAFIANCSALASRSDFAEYIEAVNDTTSFLPELLDSCKTNICASLWGDGNADVSGIGMILGYFFECLLGLLFALSLVVASPTFTRKPPSKFSTMLAKGNENFFQCAVFFTASIQISCVVVLARKDFAISADGMGGLTVKITWAISLLCMLSLLCPMVTLNFTDKGSSNYRFFLFCACYLLFFYTFISRMIAEFAPSQIGEGAGEDGQTIILPDKWDMLRSVCFNVVEQPSFLEERILTAFGAAGSIIVSIYGIGYLLWFIAKQHSVSKTEIIEKKLRLLPREGKRERNIVLLTTLLVASLSIPQIWGILRLRSVQQRMAKATGNSYVDNQWSFGQVVAVMLFAPVFTDMGYFWLKSPKSEL